MNTRFLAMLGIAVSVGLQAAPCATAQILPAEVPESAPPDIIKAVPVYSDAELRTFAIAAVEVKNVTDAYLPRLQSAQTTEEKRHVESTATAEMIRAVENKGISVARFNEILTQARTDPKLAARIRQHIEDPQPESFLEVH
jgi:hypothetical protein